MIWNKCEKSGESIIFYVAANRSYLSVSSGRLFNTGWLMSVFGEMLTSPEIVCLKPMFILRCNLNMYNMARGHVSGTNRL